MDRCNNPITKETPNSFKDNCDKGTIYRSPLGCEGVIYPGEPNTRSSSYTKK